MDVMKTFEDFYKDDFLDTSNNASFIFFIPKK